MSSVKQLLQKYCLCSLDNAPICCSKGWHLVFTGFRCTQGAESNYSPNEREDFAVSWILEHSKYFVLGCPNLTVVNDHKPLLGNLNDLSTIAIQGSLKLKERTLRYQWHRGPDACSHNPSSLDFQSVICAEPSQNDIIGIAIIENHVLATHQNAIKMITYEVDINPGK